MAELKTLDDDDPEALYSYWRKRVTFANVRIATGEMVRRARWNSLTAQLNQPVNQWLARRRAHQKRVAKPRRAA